MSIVSLFIPSSCHEEEKTGQAAPKSLQAMTGDFAVGLPLHQVLGVETNFQAKTFYVGIIKKLAL